MRENFTRCLANLLVSEGGYSNHPQDPGAQTNMGVTLATYRKWIKKDGTPGDLKSITREQVAKVYRSVYWNAVKGDDLPSGVDYAVFDYAVNSGPARAVKALQMILSVTVDGQVGPETLGALKTASPVVVINELYHQRLAFLKSLKTWSTFGNGWKNRVAAVREDALQLAIQPPAEPQSPPTPAPKPIPIPIPAPVPQDKGLFGLLLAVVQFILGLFKKGTK
jgi:lysozyme family protein